MGWDGTAKKGHRSRAREAPTVHPGEMPNLLVTSDPSRVPAGLDDTLVVTPHEYVTSAAYRDRSDVRVINLCRSYRYQKEGYYASLLALARGHHPLPTLRTIQEAKSPTIARAISHDLGDLIDAAFARETVTSATRWIYFGREANDLHPELSAALFSRLPLPIMRASFARHPRKGTWTLQQCAPVGLDGIPPEHDAVLGQRLAEFLQRRVRSRRRDIRRYDLAILRDPEESTPPSNEGALRCFQDAARAEGFAVELIGRDDFGRVAEFDALFIRETTAVNHRTFRFAQRAAAEGLVVMDDPESILRCTNKVFLAEVLEKHGIPAPRTMIAHRRNTDDVARALGFPLVLKQPDSSFSQGVLKVEDLASYKDACARLFNRSDLLVAQAFTPSTFDWRIGVLRRQPLYACRYYMARQHWQIIKREPGRSECEEGTSDAVALEEVPSAILDAALRAADLMGDGLYGVDVKDVEGKALVIEVNDNPSIDAGYEDALLGDRLYRQIMAEFRRRLDARRGARKAR